MDFLCEQISVSLVVIAQNDTSRLTRLGGSEHIDIDRSNYLDGKFCNLARPASITFLKDAS